jgi:hypothetical protein
MAHNQHMLAYSGMMCGQSKLAISAINEMAAGIPKNWLKENAAIAERQRRNAEKNFQTAFSSLRNLHELANLLHEKGDPRALDVATEAIDRNFDPSISIRALQFYGDGTLDRVPAGVQRDLTRWAQAVDLDKLPALRSKRGLSPGRLER